MNRNYTVVRLLAVNDCLYVQVDVEVILQDEPAEQVDEPNVNVAELRKKIINEIERYGEASKCGQGLVGFTGEIVAPERARYL